MSPSDSSRALRVASAAFGAVVIVFIFMLTENASRAESPLQIKVDLGLADVLKQLRVWWESAAKREDITTYPSAQKLAVDFVRMANLMETFADQLDRVPPWIWNTGDTGPTSEQLGSQLHRILQEMKATLWEINDALESIDLHWAVTNLGVLDSASGVSATRGGLIDEVDSLVLTINTGQAVVIGRDDFDDLAQALRGHAAQSRAVANEIRETLVAMERDKPSSERSP